MVQYRLEYKKKKIDYKQKILMLTIDCLCLREKFLASCDYRAKFSVIWFAVRERIHSMVAVRFNQTVLEIHVLYSP